MKDLSKKVYIYTTGCQRRYLDAQKIFNYFKINGGYEIVKSPGKADYIFFNTCAFKKEQEDFSIKKIQEFKKYGKKLIVGGCLPKINEKRLAEIFEGPVFFPASINQIDEIFNPKIKFENIPDGNFLFGQIYFDKPFIKDIFQFNYKFFSTSLDRLRRTLQKNYFIRISNGCLGKCTYCGIKKAIGSLKSKPLQECLEEFKKGISRGYRNFTILGDDTGSYGLDIGETFPRLLNKFIETKGNYKIYIFELHPRWVIKYFDQLLLIVKSGKIHEIMCPIQSGSDKILQLMQRFHTAQEIREALLNFKKAFPKLRLITHILVGFPGETEEDFEKTLKFVEEIDFDYVAVYPYFERPGTPAVILPNKVSQKIINERMKKARKFLARL